MTVPNRAAVGSNGAAVWEQDTSSRGVQPQHIEWLIDNIDAYEKIAAAIESSTESIWIAQLALDPDFAVTRPSMAGQTPVTLIDTLLEASEERDVSVRILLNATLLLNTLRPLQRVIGKRQSLSPRFQMRGTSHFPSLLHAKIVIVDSKCAFLVGSPFVNGYWDSSAHVPVDDTRPVGELGGRPLHDVSVMVTGQVVSELQEFFEELWRDAEGDDSRTPFLRLEPLADSRLLKRSIPRAVLSSPEHGTTEILDEIKQALARARRLIYVEHQYLSSREVITALRDALARNDELEIVLVLNQNPDITAYARWQLRALREFGLLDHPRVGLFALWSVSSKQGGSRNINQVFVHSKVMVIDDAWAICGSANLDGVSLHSYGDDFSGFIGRRVFRDIRSFDVAVFTRSDGSGIAASPARILRERLWQEHLGAHTTLPATAPRDGWIALWRKVAGRNVATLNAGDTLPPGSFVLPFSTSLQPSAQLRDSELDVDAASLKLAFNPGWIERRFNPRWIRNMFL